MQSYLDKYQIKARELVSPKEISNASYIDIEAELDHLLQVQDWSTRAETFCNKLAKKVEITKKIETQYSLDWKKIKTSKLASSLQSSLLSFILYVSFKKLQHSNASIEEQLKRMNALMKALDLCKEKWIGQCSILYQDIESDFKLLIESLPFSKGEQSSDSLSLMHPKELNKTLALTILYSEGPIARAYLEMIKSMGFKARKIIHMVSSVDLITKKPIAKLLPLTYRIKYAAYSQESKINFWPRKIEKKYPELQNTILSEVSQKYKIPIEILQNTTKKINLLDYSENIETIFIDGLKDKKLEDKLRVVNEGAILYTGGGIVPASLLSIPDTKFIHIHPGFLPHIKGADCTLWSSLLFKRASASCFYMSPGIDVGNIIMARWMPEISFSIEEKYDVKTQYRAIYSFVDPWIRATVLREFLSCYSKFENIQATIQDEEKGYTYYFMHEKIKSAVLKSLVERHHEI